MSELEIGKVIYKLRKDNRKTQEELASFLSVSTAAVSKWERGTTYPDITLLPKIAVYFDISMDELFNYNKDLSDDEVMKISKECELKFAELEWEEWVAYCKNYLKRYPNSCLLKFRIAYLFVKYFYTTGSEEIAKEMIKESLALNEEVVLKATDNKLIEGALFQLGTYYPMIGEREKAIEALKKIHKPESNPDSIIASIYIQEGKNDEAIKILQKNLWKVIQEVNLLCLSLSSAYTTNEYKNFNKAKKYQLLSLDFIKLLSPEGDGLFNLSFAYFNLSYIAIKYKKYDEAIKNLQLMIEGLRKNPFNINYKINSIWALDTVETMEDNTQVNLYDNFKFMLSDVAFDKIRERDEFKKIVNDLDEISSCL